MKTSTESTPPIRKLQIELKSLWGAMDWPFAAVVQTPYTSPPFSETLEQLTHLLGVKASGVLDGPNGVGKSLLVKALLDQLPAKTYRPLVVTHSTLSPSDLIRHLCQLQGLPIAIRRGDNALALRKTWRELDPVWPVLVLEEAQNISSYALEELRLLACDRTDTQTPFSLLLVGDENLMARLQMGINRPLLSRLGFSLRLSPWSREDAQAYLLHRIREVRIPEDVFDPQAEELLLQTAAGIPRIINHLGQRAFEFAARAHSRQIQPEHVQRALEQMPWRGNLHRN
jgi:general secretion pathway protein A